jgi:hypothetical protein
VEEPTVDAVAKAQRSGHMFSPHGGPVQSL